MRASEASATAMSPLRLPLRARRAVREAPRPSAPGRPSGRGCVPSSAARSQRATSGCVLGLLLRSNRLRRGARPVRVSVCNLALDSQPTVSAKLIAAIPLVARRAFIHSLRAAVQLKGGETCQSAASGASVPWMRQSSGRSPVRAVRRRTKKGRRTNSVLKKPALRAAKAARLPTREGRRTNSLPKRHALPAARAAKPPARIATAWPPSAGRAAGADAVGGDRLGLLPLV